MKFENNSGGFTDKGDEYVIRLRKKDGKDLICPPRPWINVIANKQFGSLVSETGACSTWSGNSREYRLTPWFNDPVIDPHGEAFYIRDEETGAFWSPLPGPIPTTGDYEVRHGLGCTTFRHTRGDFAHETTFFVPLDDTLRIVRIRLANQTERPRRISLFSYAQLVLGVVPEESGRFISTEIDESASAAFARSRRNEDFAERVAFATAVSSRPWISTRFTCCRGSFIGRNGSTARPAAILKQVSLDGVVGAGLAPCFAQQVLVDIPSNGSVEVAFLLGDGENAEAARAMIQRYRAPGSVDRALDAVRAFSAEGTSGIRIETPDPALDTMVNSWLPYQVLGCRIWARTAFYQSGGAFGYRDQLQDAASLIYLWPELTRKQILLHAAHQFVEGDVLHWWHPPLGRGIRTRFVDDLLWLPYLAAFYIRTTGDMGILDEVVRFIEAPSPVVGEDEIFVLPRDACRDSDLYEHCCRAVDRSLITGARGLPLFGTGDWNDGMNRVGREGRGESVWMGFFLSRVIDDFLPLCERRGDMERAARYRAFRERLWDALNDSGWDGDWYRRGFYDSGEPLGSSSSDECRIDALAQAWAVISGAAPADRAARAIDSVERSSYPTPTV